MHNLYKYLVLLAAAVLLSFSALANGDGNAALQCLTDRLDRQCLNFDYSYNVVGKTVLKGSGHVTTQGNAYVMEGNGVRIVSDGVSRWMIDEEAGEVVIESVDGYADIVANPILCLRNWKEYFKVTSESKNSDGSVTVCLSPNAAGISSSVTAMSVTFRNGEIVRSEMDLRKEGHIRLEMSNVKWSDLLPASSFSYDASKNKSFIITDLR